MSDKLWWRNAIRKQPFSPGFSHVKAFDSSLYEHGGGGGLFATPR